jgi:hypothetical protein
MFPLLAFTMIDGLYLKYFFELGLIMLFFKFRLDILLIKKFFSLDLYINNMANLNFGIEFFF